MKERLERINAQQNWNRIEEAFVYINLLFVYSCIQTAFNMQDREILRHIQIVRDNLGREAKPAECFQHYQLQYKDLIDLQSTIKLFND